MMNSEKTTDKELRDFNKNRISTVIKNFKKRRMNAYYAEDELSANNLVFELIEQFKGAIPDWKGEIGIADSTTLHQIDLFERLAKEDLTVYNPFDRLEDGRYRVFEGQPNEWLPKDVYIPLFNKVFETMRRALATDVFIAGANAITRKGDIVSTDGVGNRLAGVIFGPKKVIMVVGSNKIVGTIDEALDRIKNIAAPLNHIRHANKHDIQFNKLLELPCVEKGFCHECKHPNCTRRCTMILQGPVEDMYKDRIHLIIVGKSLGL
ncbi:MAG: lactate utilization protein [Bacteroidales bacterium]|nr:lactate utilization protein [Candidatus Latescibacterota bacterium]